MSDLFSNSLKNFISDFASGNAIRRFADKGYSVKEISSLISYPLPQSQIASIVWKHYIDTGVILLHEPTGGEVNEKISYVKEYDKYGRFSLRRVVERSNISEEYVKCDFGKRKYQNPKEYELWLDTLSPKDRDYIEGLPWPIENVYHVMDDRMSRVMKARTI